MNRYVFRFSKTGNLRFISHLDLQRLFRRSIKRAGIKVAYSQGYNPHELINVVEALSLGFESTGDYFEIVTMFPYDEKELLTGFNATFPEGLKFTSCRELPVSSKNLSTKVDSALYEAILPITEDAEIKLLSFLAQDCIFILKKDKKTKALVEKDVKQFVYEMKIGDRTKNYVTIMMRLRCASNETLNPSKLLASLWSFCGLEYPADEARIVRKEMFAIEDGILKPLGEIYA